MKKTYMQPAVSTTRIETINMIAGSGELGVFSNDTEGISSNDAVLSRRGGQWDDED